MLGSGQVRICVDLKHLNESVQREYHPLSHVEETLAQLTGAQVFTKLDAGKQWILVDPTYQEMLVNHIYHPASNAKLYYLIKSFSKCSKK